MELTKKALAIQQDPSLSKVITLLVEICEKIEKPEVTFSPMNTTIENEKDDNVQVPVVPGKKRKNKVS